MSLTTVVGFHGVKTIVLRQTGEDSMGNPWGDLTFTDHAGNEDKVSMFWPKGTMPVLGWSAVTANEPAAMPDPIAVKLDNIIARAASDAEVPF